MEFKKAFDYIVGKVEEELVKQNYTKQKVVAENDNELVSLFTSASLAYSVVYYKDKEQMVLRSCTLLRQKQFIPTTSQPTLKQTVKELTICLSQLCY